MRKFLIGLLILIAGCGIGFFASHLSQKVNDDLFEAYGDPLTQTIIEAVITQQSDAWNRGDIDAFMDDYWKSESLRFASGGNITKGWQETLERYKARYPDKAAMGTLAFTELDVTVFNPQQATAFGRWTLTRENDAPAGYFTLHFKKVNGEWKIVSDHTSSAS